MHDKKSDLQRLRPNMPPHVLLIPVERKKHSLTSALLIIAKSY